MKLTDEQKQRITGALGHSLGGLHARIDGVEVKFEVRSCGNLQYIIVPFVDGAFKGGWLSPDCEEFGARLLSASKRRVIPKKEVAVWRKLDKKRAAELDARRVTVNDFFRDPRKLVTHLQREFDSFEILGAEQNV